jgi:hypothetical protein
MLNITLEIIGLILIKNLHLSFSYGILQLGGDKCIEI